MIGRYWTQLRFLFLAHLLEERGWWFGTLVVSTLFPVLLVFGLGYVGGERTREGLTYVVTGSVVISLTTMGVTMLAQMLGQAKERGDFLYYASLPISKSAFVAALLGAKLAIQLPGVLAALVTGSLIHGFPLVPSPVTLLVIPLTALSLSGVGAALGLLSRSYQATNALSQLILFVVMFASPVMIPAELLPAPLRWLGYALPPSYAADALRRSTAGLMDARLALDLAVLGAFGVVSLVGVARGLRWRLA